MTPQDKGVVEAIAEAQMHPAIERVVETAKCSGYSGVWDDDLSQAIADLERLLIPEDTRERLIAALDDIPWLMVPRGGNRASTYIVDIVNTILPVITQAPPDAATAECPECGGSGTVIDDGPNWSRSPKHRKCPTCKGTGRVASPDAGGEG